MADFAMSEVFDNSLFEKKNNMLSLNDDFKMSRVSGESFLSQ